jgi:hypothetical protein
MRFSVGDLQTIVPAFELVEEAPLATAGGPTFAWHATAMGAAGEPLGSGMARTRTLARQIAIAEAIERAVARRLAQMEASAWALDRYPSTCGFAVGQAAESARRRAICEAVERWIWEQWIEEGAEVPEVDPQVVLGNSLVRLLLEPFQSLRCFSLSLAAPSELAGATLRFAAIVAFGSGGAFAGSRVAVEDHEEDPWEHAAIECRRNLIVASGEATSWAGRNFIEARVRHHARDAADALEALARQRRPTILAPRLSLLREGRDLGFGWRVARAVCAGLRGWHVGDERRFVY